MKKLIAWVKYMVRITKWAIKSLWTKYTKPSITDDKPARRKLRKAYKPLLQGIDRYVNSRNITQYDKECALQQIRIYVARRRLGIYPYQD